ncbi:SDR family NAD(P)-dependent oxidoreductase [Streptomyces sp. NBC_00258]|uniref:SDR family NAD(P)-dependent oxidoreductase n=1 Tax=Streptomyces sp. NBC_00258 TaxID=2903642 RepID=UPI002E2E108A|nr:SDR family NAD(P)-dependent oxidoreductase [Streptomyces sp. NBC_00258]
MADSSPGGRTNTPIAVVGIGCRFPGARGAAEFWELLCAGRDMITEVPADRFDIDAFHAPGPVGPGMISTRSGGFVDGFDAFDAGFFGIAPKEAAHMDPQQRLLLETSHDALADAGIAADRLAGSSTGVFVGQLTADYWDTLSRDGTLDIYANTGTTRAVTSGRVSYAFDLRGPSLTLDTACSSALTAVHLACESLRGGESTLALACGINLVLRPEPSITFSQAGMLAPDGRCKFASPEADGFVRSDGVAVVVLKTLEQAEADGDDIYAVLLGSAVTSDGEGSGYLLTPSAEGQEQTLRSAYRNAGADPAAVGYVEAHGTGTAIGDRVELTALARVLGEGRTESCRVGSVKTNIGHTEATAGLAGLIKTALCLKHRRIPASLHAEKLTDSVDWDELPLVVQRELVDWEAEGPRLAGVSSFGISGTNAHVVLAEYVAENAEPSAAASDDDGPVLLPLSARGPAALRRMAVDMADFLGPDGAGRAVPLRRIAATAATRREHLDSRLAVVGSTHDELADALRAFAADEPAPGLRSADDVADTPARTVFVFPGQGSQWVGMGRELLATSPVFHEALARCDEAVRAETGWSVLDRIADDAPLTGIDVVQPTLWAIEVALAELWRSWGVAPDVVVGHSMGEAAAACITGALSVEDAAAVICRRSLLLRQVAGKGAMAYVELNADEAEREIADCADTVSVAVINGPRATVLAGAPAALEEILARLTARDVFTQMIKVDVASHSPQMDPLREQLLDELSFIEPRSGRIPLHSTVHDEVLDGSQLGTGYWVLNLREPVRFGPVVQGMLSGGRSVFIEMSPHPVLVPAMQECLALAGRNAGAAVPSLRRDEPERAALLDAVATLYTAGVPVDWEQLGYQGRPVRLPMYPWQGTRHWYTPARQAVPAPARGPVAPAHPLLGTRRDEGADLVWEDRLDLHTAGGYLADHEVQGAALLPGTAYVEMMTAAARQAFAPRTPSLADLSCHRALFLRPGDNPLVQVRITGSDAPIPRIEVRSSLDGEPMIVHATAQVRLEGVVPTGRDAVVAARSAARERAVRHRQGTAFYADSARSGNHWGPAFQGITELWDREGEALARIQAPAALPLTDDGQLFHPALLDACAQVLSATVTGEHGAASEVFVLERMDAVSVYGTPRGPLWSHAVRTSGDAVSYTGDITVCADDGTVLSELRGVRLRYLERDVGRPDAPRPPHHRTDPQDERELADWLYALDWRPVAARPQAALPDGPWLVLADRQGVGAVLTERLRAAGHRCVRVSAGAGHRRLDEDAYEIDPASPDDHTRLLAELDGTGPWRLVHLWGLDAAAYDGCRGVLNLGRSLHRLTGGVATYWLVTRGAQTVSVTDRVAGPDAGAVWGMARAMAREHPGWGLRLVDLGASDGADALLAELCRDGAEDQVALRSGTRVVPRLAARLWRQGADGSPNMSIRVQSPGVLDELRPAPVERTAPGHGRVEIRVDHVGLNYRDLLLALGALPDASGATLGLECSGTVTAVGADVTTVREGDEVVAIVEDGLARYVTTSAYLVAPRPAGLSAVEAATLPIALVTAYQAMLEVARLREGDRVLIHSATGGVGMAALQLARWKNLDVYATAGSSERRALLRTLGVRHVADSRSLAFVDMVREATAGQGVHAVLNTLGGAEAISANLSLITAHGTYVELTKRDLYAGAHIDLRPLLRNVSFSVVDVVEMLRRRPHQVGGVLAKVLRLVATGDVSPLPYQVFPLDHAAKAYREMAAARHIGKLLVSVGRSDAQSPAASRIHADATYLVSGGLGGLGQEVAHWLADRGARHLLLIGRTPLPGDGTEDPRLARLRAKGVRVDYEALDVTDEPALRAVLDRRARACRPPVRGVVHAAGVVLFRSLGETTDEDLAASLRPKGGGALTLHRSLDGDRANTRLDFFVLFSSGSSILASPMLGAYAAGNAALDSFAHWRRQEGLHALSVNWGFWSEAGLAAKFDRVEGRPLAPAGIATFTPAQGLRILERLLAEDATQAMVMPADWERWAATYPEAASTALLSDVLSRGLPTAAPTPLLETPVELTPDEPSASGEPTVSADAGPTDDRAEPGGRDLSEYLTRKIAEVLGLPLDQVSRNRPLNRQGMDSLMAVAVRTRVQEELGVTMSMAKMLGGQTISELAGELAVDVTAGTAS